MTELRFLAAVGLWIFVAYPLLGPELAARGLAVGGVPLLLWIHRS